MDVSKRYLAFEAVALPWIALAGGTAFFYFAAPILIPIVISVSLAYILSPLVALLNRLKIPHTASVVIVLLISLSLLGILLYLLSLQVNNFVEELSANWNAVLNFIKEVKAKLVALGLRDTPLMAS